VSAIAPATAEPAAARTRAGFVAGFSAYALWGFLPLLFHLLDGVGSVTVVANRTLWSLLFVGVVIVASRRLGEVRAALRDRATLRSMFISTLLLGGNWLIYIWAVDAGQVLESSFGYFINPLVNVAIGVLFLGERQNRWQWVAIAVAVVAIAIQAIGVGRIPFIALGLALTFGFYGFFRKTARVNSASGLFVETLILCPLALLWIGWTLWQQGGPGVLAQPYYFWLLALTGPATAVPLLLFAFAVQRLRFTTAGMLQYVGPTIQFLLAILVLGESINATQWLSFGLIWVSLIIYSADSVARRRSPARVGPAEPSP